MTNLKSQKISIPHKIMQLLWTDDSFYSTIEKDKRVSIARFPKVNQYCDQENNFYMEFALAGYSAEDISISHVNSTITISSEKISDKFGIQQGLISRGIAKRKFEVSYLINSNYDIENSVAKMMCGLLVIQIPQKTDNKARTIKVEEK